MKKNETDIQTSVPQQKAELEESFRQKELSIREIFHRTKNNLQTISSLFELQLMSVDDPELKEKLTEGFGRFQVMVFIYRELSSSNGYSEINFGKFINNLFEYLCGLFRNHDRLVSGTINIPEFTMDVDTAIPLGLIINEIMVNSLKNYSGVEKNLNISISIFPAQDQEWVFVFHDNAEIGNEEFGKGNSPASLSTRLILGLSTQIGGRTEYSYEHGNVFRIFFRNSTK